VTHRGRPAKLKDPQNFTVRLERGLVEAARDAAWERRVTLSEIVREAFTRLVREAKRHQRRSNRE
jgi:hypothetical protein